MKRHILSLLLVVAAVGVSWGGSITHSTGVTASQFGYTTVGDSCVVLSMGDAELSYEPLQPQLPVFYYTFVVPTNCKVTNVTYRASITRNYTLPYPVQCAPEAIPTGDVSSAAIGDLIPTEPFNPYTPFKIVSDGYFDGDIHLVTVAFSPVKYTKGDTTLSLSPYSSFTLNYTEGTTADNVAVLHPRGRDTDKRRQLINSMVVNPASTPSYIPVSPSYLPPTQQEQTAGLGYNYLVITTRELYATAQKLIDWKRSKGLNAGAVCIEDILSQTWEDNQSKFTEIDDAAGKLRVYLRNAYAMGLEYAFLVSERGEIPYRNYFVNGGTPTDFYYCELNSEWSLFTFITDINTYSYTEKDADIAIGRLFTSDTEELSSYIDRLITYERNPGNGSPDYVMRGFFIQSDEMQRDRHANFIADSISDCFSDITIWEESPGYNADTISPISPKGKDVINELQNNPCGYFSPFAHGWQSTTNTYAGGLAGKYNGVEDRCIWTIRSVENDTITSYWYMFPENGCMEQGAGVDLLQLPHNPFIVYSIACTTMPYDTIATDFHPVTLGVAFTAKSESAVAYLGNTRSGSIINNNPNWGSTKLQRLFNNEILAGNIHIGKAENLSKKEHKDPYLIVAHNILGCPEIPMWTAVPQKIKGDFLPSDSVSIISLSGEIMQASAAEVTDDIVNSTISLIRKNYYPYYFTTRLKNYVFTGKHTLFGSDFIIGCESNDSASDFIVEQDSELHIEATGNVTLKPGTTIKSGGTLTIKHVKQ